MCYWGPCWVSREGCGLEGQGGPQRAVEGGLQPSDQNGKWNLFEIVNIVTGSSMSSPPPSLEANKLLDEVVKAWAKSICSKYDTATPEFNLIHVADRKYVFKGYNQILA